MTASGIESSFDFARECTHDRGNPVKGGDMSKKYYVYIATNQRNTVLYTGCTNNIERRIHEHKQKVIKGFTAKYNVNKLVYLEEFAHAKDAVDRETQIKAGSRQKKIKFIHSQNPEWKDLSIF